MNKSFNLLEYCGHEGGVMELPNEDPVLASARAVAPDRRYKVAKRKLQQETRWAKTRSTDEKPKTGTSASSGDVTVAAMTHVRMSHLKVVDATDGSTRLYWFRDPTKIDLMSAKAEVIARLTLGTDYVVFGSGRYRRTAIESLCQNVDQQIQRLYRCLPMQLCDEEQVIRESLESLFDLDRYRDGRRTEAVELAKFSRVKGLYRFECFGGSDIVIEPTRCTGLFGDLKDGDWCEIAVRKRVRGGMVESVQLQRMADEPLTWSEEEFRRELSELPKADFPPLPDGPIRLN